MADSYVTATGDGTAGPFSFSVLDYLDVAHIGVKVDGVAQTLTDHYTVSGTDVTFVAGYEPATATVVKIHRSTPRSKAERLVDFADGTVLHEGDLDTASLQNLYIAQEGFEENENVVAYDASLSAYTASSLEIKNLAEPTTDSSAASRKYVTDTASFGVPGIPQQDNSEFDGSTTQRTLVGWTGISQSMVLASLDGVVQIPGTDFSLAAVDDNTVLTIIGVSAGDLNGSKLNVQNFGVAKSSNTIDDGSVTEAKIATDAVTATKIAADAVGSSEIAADAVGEAEIADSAVDLARLKTTGFTDTNVTGNAEFLKVANATSDLSLGVLTSAEITDLNSTLNAKPISIFGAATGNVSLGDGTTNYKITNLAWPTSAADAATRGWTEKAIGTAMLNAALGTVTATGTGYVVVPIGAAASYYDPDGLLSVSTSDDSITLTAGYVYRIDVSLALFGDYADDTTATVTLRTEGGGTTYATDTVPIGEAYGSSYRNSAAFSFSAVIDRTAATLVEKIDVVLKGANSNRDITARQGWISAQRIF